MKLLSPLYWAVSVFDPAVVEVSEQPPVATAAEQLAPVPSFTLTVPVGVPLPECSAVTVQVTV